MRTYPAFLRSLAAPIGAHLASPRRPMIGRSAAWFFPSGGRGGAQGPPSTMCHHVRRANLEARIRGRARAASESTAAASTGEGWRRRRRDRAQGGFAGARGARDSGAWRRDEFKPYQGAKRAPAADLQRPAPHSGAAEFGPGDTARAVSVLQGRACGRHPPPPPTDPVPHTARPSSPSSLVARAGTELQFQSACAM